jgi:putative tricarboxylic transport membrane protein
MLEPILSGLVVALEPANLLFVLIGVTAGIAVGAIPGLSGPMAIALCIPLTYYMSPVAAIGFLVGLNKGAFFGGSISAILLRTPGTPEATATTWDGYPLASQGRGQKALRMALFASVSGDAFSTLVLILVAAPLAAVALYMGPPEIFALICLALTIIAGLGSQSLARGLIAAAFGVLVGTVGTEPVSALPRLTFEIYQLERGLSLIPIGIGMLALSEIIIQLERHIRQGGCQETLTFSEKREDRLITWSDFRASIKTILRSSGIGTVVGAMPGIGAPVASFFAYDQAKKASKNPSEYGQGKLDGIAAAESANSSVVGASLIPLFTLGIPGNLAAAMLIGAFVLHGMMPGPLMFEQNAPMIYAIFGSLLIANLFLLGVGRLGLTVYCAVLKTPAAVLYPIVIFTCIAGAYMASYSVFDVKVMLVFAVIGYVMRKLDFSFVCFIIGFILAPMWETALQQVIIASQFNPYMFFTRPVAMLLMAITLYVVIRTTIGAVRMDRNRRVAKAQ